ncbi:Uncharacterised protein [Vibrio cholerae]|uniref:Uncharacterized protein n=1 Tax=Vibrio cholerae TaxID=666 RepID=A0A656AT68_VIBCL|nr:Uncharacterised protein [Vibrio cholerae]CSD34393.1 Uncharacterised protein [Vibrio cholerae]CSI77011.1 Uncharacterised protein [Vibrio cholerae]
MLSVSIPNSATALPLVDSAAKCLATCASSPAAFKNQSRAVWALVMVSWVVKVLEATKKRVVSGSTFFSVSAMCVPSTFDTKCMVKWFL